MGKPRGYVIVGAFSALVGFVIGASLGSIHGSRFTKVEAVRTGHARYRIVDEYGNTEFEWIGESAAPAAPDAPEPEEGKTP